MPVHPDPDKKLYGFVLTFANGEKDMGLIVATDRETAHLQLENDSFACYAVDITIDQPTFIDRMVEEHNGLVYFASTPKCN